MESTTFTEIKDFYIKKGELFKAQSIKGVNVYALRDVSYVDKYFMHNYTTSNITRINKEDVMICCGIYELKQSAASKNDIDSSYIILKTLYKNSILYIVDYRDPLYCSVLFLNEKGKVPFDKTNAT